jgi:predicted DNA-binding transcriptional regulator AlpA
MPRYDALPANLPPRGLHREAAAQYIGISPGKFDEMIVDGRMPKAVQIDGRKVWDRRALDLAFDALGETIGVSNPWDQILIGTPARTKSKTGNTNNSSLANT